MEQQQELFGKLFNTIPLYNEDHLDILLSTMDKEQSIYILSTSSFLGWFKHVDPEAGIEVFGLV